MGQYAQEDGKYSQVSFVKTNKNKVTGLILGNDKGGISIFGYPF